MKRISKFFFVALSFVTVWSLRSEAATTLSVSERGCLLGSSGTCSVTIYVGAEVPQGGRIGVYVSQDGAAPTLFTCYSTSGSYWANATWILAGSSYVFTAFGTSTYATASGCPASPAGSAAGPSASVNAVQSSVATHGLIDPSVTHYGGTTYLAYSEMNSAFEGVNHKIVTKYVYSSNGGSTWSNAGTAALNQAYDVLLGPTQTTRGTWTSETAELIYDPNGDAGQKFKLLWMRYLEVEGAATMSNSWIALKQADTVAGLSSAPEIKLFSGDHYNSENNTFNNATKTPVTGSPLVPLSNMASVSALSNCTAFTEPSIVAYSSALYVSMLCGLPNVSGSFVFLMKCASPCNMTNPSSWQYLGQLNVPATGYRVDETGNPMGPAPSLFLNASGAPHLVVSDIDHKGCRVYPFTNINTASLSSTNVMVYGPKSANSDFLPAGSCSYHQNATGSGMMFSVKDLSANPVASRLGKSGVNF